MKECKYCNAVKPLEEFHKHERTKDRRQGHCKECHYKRVKAWRKKNKERTKELQRNRLYNLEENWYEEQLTKQEFRCAGCLRHQSELEYALCVDHCHDSGIARGLLCKPCNLALGNCNDSRETLKRLINYLDSCGPT